MSTSELRLRQSNQKRSCTDKEDKLTVQSKEHKKKVKYHTPMECPVINALSRRLNGTIRTVILFHKDSTFYQYADGATGK